MPIRPEVGMKCKLPPRPACKLAAIGGLLLSVAAMQDNLASIVRRHDPDRFLTALFAPPEARATLMVLYAFNHELARAREVASEPPLALIRLQWWREVVEGTRKRHEVATPLSDAIGQGMLLPADLLAMIDAREEEAEPEFASLSAWRSWLLAGAGSVSVAAARLLGAGDGAEAFRPLGAAYGVSGVLRSLGVAAGQGRCLLPLDLLGAEGLAAEEMIADPGCPGVRRVADGLARMGLELVSAGRTAPVTRATVAAALPAVLARRDLARWPRVDLPRRFGDRFAVTWAGLLGRIR